MSLTYLLYILWLKGVGIIDVAVGVHCRPVCAGQDAGQEDVDAAGKEDMVCPRQATQHHVADPEQGKLRGRAGCLKAEFGHEVGHTLLQVVEGVHAVVDGRDLHHICYEVQKQDCTMP